MSNQNTDPRSGFRSIQPGPPLENPEENHPRWYAAETIPYAYSSYGNNYPQGTAPHTAPYLYPSYADSSYSQRTLPEREQHLLVQENLHHHSHPRSSALPLPKGPPPIARERESLHERMVGKPGFPLPIQEEEYASKRHFTPEEDQLLIDLKENYNLTWNQIADFFARPSGSLQGRYSTKLKERVSPWTQDKVCYF